jgi:hypothetical protein
MPIVNKRHDEFGSRLVKFLCGLLLFGMRELIIVEELNIGNLVA